MKFSRKLMLALGATVLPLATVALVGAGPASAARSGVTGTGNVNCTHVTGTIHFSPPLKNGGTAAETGTVTASASGCSGGTPAPTTVSSSGTFGTNNDCAGLGTGTPPSFTGTYTPAGIDPSATSGGTETGGIVGGKLTFSISNATTTGSFPSTTTTISAKTTETLKKLNKACKKKGLKSLTIASGSVMNL